jgi:extradiol dioxygenase family protein
VEKHRGARGVQAAAVLVTLPRMSTPAAAAPTAARFHLSLSVKDLELTRGFYAGVLGCPQGRRGADWLDFSFFGHQLTCALRPDRVAPADAADLAGRHFGAIIPAEAFDRLARQLAAARATFLVEPHAEEAGTARERRKMIVLDPSGNAIELKTYRDESLLFST